MRPVLHGLARPHHGGVRGGLQQAIADLALEAAHHRQRGDQDHHAQRDADDRGQRDEGDETVAALGAEIAQADGDGDGLEHAPMVPDPPGAAQRPRRPQQAGVHAAAVPAAYRATTRHAASAALHPRATAGTPAGHARGRARPASAYRRRWAGGRFPETRRHGEASSPRCVPAIRPRPAPRPRQARPMDGAFRSPGRRPHPAPPAGSAPPAAGARDATQAGS